MKAQLLNILRQHQGRQNAIKACDLAALLNENERAVRLAIRELIAEGVPVASSTESPAGYFIITTYAEIQEYSESIKGRLIEDAIRRRNFRRAAFKHLEEAHQGVLL